MKQWVHNVWLICLFVVWSTHSTQAQVPDWQLAVIAASIGPESSSGIRASAADADGNVFIAGTFTGVLQLGSISLTLSAGSSQQLYVAKWNPATQDFLWALQAGSSGSQIPFAMAATSTGIYVTGSFSGPTLDLGTTVLVNPVSPPSSSSEMFIAKIGDSGPSGRFVWAERAGGMASEYPQALAASGANIYVAGFFSGTAAVFGTTTLTAPDFLDNSGFVTKLIDRGNSGQFVWTQPAGGAGSAVNSLAIRNNNIFVGGRFSRSAPLGNILLTASSGDAYVAQLTDTGNGATYTKAQALGGASDLYVSALAVSGTSLYLGGSFNTTTRWLGSPPLSSRGSSDTYVAKFSEAGTGWRCEWVQRAGSDGGDRVTHLQAVGTNIYAAGEFTGTQADFGPDRLTSGGAAPFNTPDLFLSKLTDRGSSSQFAWTRQGGSALNDASYSLIRVGSRLYAAGIIFTPATFGRLTLNTSSGRQSGVFAALDDDSQLTETTGLCAGEPRQLTAPAGAQSYRWSTGATTAAITVTQPGRYTVVCTYADGSTDTLVQQVTAAALPAAFSLGADTTACEGTTVLLRPSISPPGATYRWSDGSAESTLQVREPGTYTVQLTTDCGSVSAGRQVSFQSCRLVPNVITPNGDQFNDRFSIRRLPAGQWNLTLYNRWGRSVYHDAKYQDTWGTDAPAGVYYYHLRERTTGRVYKGWLEVIR